MATLDWSKVVNFTIPEGTVTTIKNSAGQIIWQAYRTVMLDFGHGVAQATVEYTPAGGSRTSKVLYCGNRGVFPDSISGGDYASVWSHTLYKVTGPVSVTVNKYFNNYSRPSGWTSDTITSSIDTKMTITPVLGSIPLSENFTESNKYSYYYIGGSYSGGSGSILNGTFHDMTTSFMEIISNCDSLGSPSSTDTYYQLIRNQSAAEALFANGAEVYKIKTTTLAYSNLWVRPTYSDNLVNGLTLNPTSYSKETMRVPALTWTRYQFNPTYNRAKMSTSNQYVFLLKLGTAQGSEWQVAWPANSIVADCPDAEVTNPITSLYLSYRPDGDDSDYISSLKYFVSYYPLATAAMNNYYCEDGVWHNASGTVLYDAPGVGEPSVISGLAKHTNSWSEFSKYFYTNYDNTQNYYSRYIYAVWDAGWVYNP